MNESTREALADAANTVDGIDCRPYYLPSTKQGAGFIRLDRIEYPNQFGGICYWQVVVLLPQDQNAAERYLDDKARDLVEALRTEMVVERVTPQQIQFDSTAIQALFVEGFREEE